MSLLTAIDPGRNKCGLVLVDLDKELVIEGKIVRSESVIDLINQWKKTTGVERTLLGNGTTSSVFSARLKGILCVELVEEKGTTLLARERFWEIWPPSGWRSWLPRGLIVPPYDLDAVAALLLIESYLGKKFSWSGLPNFKTVP